MKKFAIILVILCLAASVIPAWAEPETDWAEGRWRLYNIGVNEGDATSFHAPEEFGVEREIYFLPDGTGLFYIKDNEKGGFAPFQWHQDASSPNVLQTNFGELTYVATVQELQLNSDDGVERFFYRKVDWPVQIPAKKKAEKIEDYYGMWKLRAADGSSLGFNGLFDANALGNIYQAYFFVNKNGVSLHGSRMNRNFITEYKDPSRTRPVLPGRCSG